MNNIEQISCKYLASNKTVESYSISIQENEILFFVYNYKGISFRVFKSRNKLEGFWSGSTEEDLHFNSEEKLDQWLESFEGN